MNRRSLAYWIPTVLFALAATAAGLMDLLATPEMLAGMSHLGFPMWFPRWLGAWKLAGVAVLLLPGLPRLKEWATAGFVINLTSAAVAHMVAGDEAGYVATPLVLLSLGLASWYFRPTSRRMEVTAPAATAFSAA